MLSRQRQASSEDLDKAVQKKSGRKLTATRTWKKLSEWWETEGKANAAADDKIAVIDAGLYGDRNGG